MEHESHSPEIETMNSEQVIKAIIDRMERYFSQSGITRTAKKRENLCDFASGGVRYLLLREGNKNRIKLEPKIIRVGNLWSQLAREHGFIQELDFEHMFVHGVCLAKDTNDRVFLIDPAFVQFLDASTGEIRQGKNIGSGVHMDETGLVRDTAQALLDQEYIEITNENIQALLQLFADKAAHSLLQRVSFSEINVGALFDALIDDHNPNNWTDSEYKTRFDE